MCALCGALLQLYRDICVVEVEGPLRRRRCATIPANQCPLIANLHRDISPIAAFNCLGYKLTGALCIHTNIECDFN